MSYHPRVSDEHEALDWLYGFTDWERGIGWGSRVGPDPNWNLGRTRWLLDQLGAPDRRLTSVIIAGTKGKGSTAVITESILRAAGVSTMLYTQPHLHSYRERIRLDGKPISGPLFAALVDRLREPVAHLSDAEPKAGEPTTYEITTALALLSGQEHGAQVAILEVGLGGRLDATNCVDAAVSAVTRISYDHTQILGRTLGAIAREKVAIARAGRPLISAPQRPAAKRAIVAAARGIGAHYRFVEPFPARDSGEPLVGQPVWARLLGDEPFAASLALRGAHQRENAAVAVGIVEALAPQGLVHVSAANVQVGLQEVTWAGRLEVISNAPIIVVDGAHNGESAERLQRALEQEFSYERLVLVLGILKDKDARAMVRALVPRAATVVVTRSENPRAMEPSELATICRRYCDDVQISSDVPSAMDLARAQARDSDLICATGSLSIVAEARQAILGERSSLV